MGVEQGAATAHSWAGQQFGVRPVTGSAATKDYRCPGCDLLIPARTPHVVVWPLLRSLTGRPGTEVRRHWHTGCWRSRSAVRRA